MAAPETAKPDNTMKAVALFFVLVVAKTSMLAGRPLHLSGWGIAAYFWQDLLVALVFGFFDLSVRRFKLGNRIAWICYAGLVTYVAINVPVARLLSSPLTFQMLGATRGALLDSIKYHATPINLLLIALVTATGISVPLLLRASKSHLERLESSVVGVVAAGVVLLALILLGPQSTSRVDIVGRGRNAVTALAISAMPRITARASDSVIGDAWRTRFPNSEPSTEDLASLQGTASGRNVVMILLESAGAEYLNTHDNEVDPMPSLSLLKRSAVMFENAYSVYPESIKGLFSVLCSRYPAMDSDDEEYSRITTPSIAEVLKRNGYHTALFHSGRFMYLGMESVVENRGYDVLEDAGAIGGNHESSFGVDEAATVRRALSWIDTVPRDQHFFLTYLPIAGHHPYDTPTPGPFKESSDRGRYLNALHYADDSLQELMEGLRARGLEQRTLYLIFGDHGEAFGQHEGNYGHSLFLFDENVHVPYLLAAPGLIGRQLPVSRAISLIDTAPTILDLLGLKCPSEYQGISALEDKTEQALFYTDYSLSLLGLRDGRWKYIHEMESNRSRLFDVSSDPGELVDRSSEFPDRVAAYRSRLLRWASAQKALIRGAGE